MNVERARSILLRRGPSRSRVSGVALAVLLASSFLMGGCGGRGAAAGGRALTYCPVFARVTNHTWAPVTVFAIGGSKARLGTVGAWQAARFVLPRAVLSPGRRLRLSVRPLAEAEVLTDELAVWAGQEVLWTIREPLEQSVASVRISHDPSGSAGDGELACP